MPVPPSRHLLRAKDLADARYAEPLTVDDLAAAARLSPAHFSREFRRAFGESPHQYLLTRRLERAASLLRSTDWSVARICVAVGPEQRRVVHHELRADVRDAAHGLPLPTRRPPRWPGCPPASSRLGAARRSARFEKTRAAPLTWTEATHTNHPPRDTRTTASSASPPPSCGSTTRTRR